jgi:predicted translin family RNA/ssDNA-binding protein
VDEEIYYLRYNASEYVNAVEGGLRDKSRIMGARLERLKESAFRRGEDPKVRALAAGRSWVPEDVDMD